MGGGGREGGSSARPTTLCIVTVARPSLGARRGGVVLVNCRYPVENTHKPGGLRVALFRGSGAKQRFFRMTRDKLQYFRAAGSSVGRRRGVLTIPKHPVARWSRHRRAVPTPRRDETKLSRRAAVTSPASGPTDAVS